jgi:hypothetical protein
VSSIALEIAYFESLAARQAFVDNECKDAVPEERLFCFGAHGVKLFRRSLACGIN